MSKFILDLTNYKDRFGAKVAEGRYHVVVEDAELDKSKAGNQMVNVWLRIADGDFAGSTLTDRLTMTEKSLFRVVAFMQAIGLPTPKKRLQMDLRQFIGKHLFVDVEDGDPYNGTVRSEVRGYARVTKDDLAAASEGTDDLDEADDDDDDDDLEDVTDDPTDYDEDEEPEKVEAAERKRAASRKPEPEPEPEDNAGPEEIDLDDIDL